MTRWSVRLLTVLVAGMVAGGCGGLFKRTKPAQGAGPTLNFKGHELCIRSVDKRGGYVHRSTELRADQPDAERLRRMMCSAEPGGRLSVDLDYESYERDLTALERAMIVVQCATEGPCNSRAIGSGRKAGRRYIVARTADWRRHAEGLDTAEAVRQAQAAGLAEPLLAGFSTRLVAAKQVLLDCAATLNPEERRVFGQVPAQVRERFRNPPPVLRTLAAEATPILQEFERVVLDKRADPELVMRALDLRDRYAKACMEHGQDVTTCLNGPIARPLTERIITASVFAGLMPLGEAEARQLERAYDRIEFDELADRLLGHTESPMRNPL